MTDDFEQLLVVQAHDTKIAQLAHRRVTLPAAERASALAEALATLTGQRNAIQAKLDAVRLDQSRLEDKAQLIESKREKESAKLYSGSVTAIKELQALEDEIASLERQRNGIEDDVLVLMEQAEPLVGAVTDLDAKITEVTAKRNEALDEVASDEAAIDAEIASETAARNQAAAPIPAELMERYEGIRAEAGGVGVARFSGSRCEGCHLTLSAVEADTIKKAPPDAAVTCGSCGRILVR